MKALMAAMKLLISFVQNADARSLTEHGFRVMTVASTGGLLRRGNTAIVSGVEDDMVPDWLALVDSTCRERVESLIYPDDAGFVPWLPPDVVEVIVGGATVFVLDVVDFARIRSKKAVMKLIVAVIHHDVAENILELNRQIRV